MLLNRIPPCVCFFLLEETAKKCKCFAELYRFFISFFASCFKNCFTNHFLSLSLIPTVFPGKFIKDTPGKQILADGVSWSRNSTVEHFLVLFRGFGALRLEHHVPFSVPPGKLIILVEGTPTIPRTEEEACCTCRGGMHF